ncbi:MAG: GNAT family N-acetyltransferase [Prosthecobacter sp.]
MPFHPERELRTVLADGTPLLLRSLRPEDRDDVAAAFRRLSPDALYFRFWARFREVNPRLVEQICSPDQKDHVGWAILHETRDDIPCVAGASLWRLKDDPQAAEVSFTVADEFQGRGLGTLLLAVLWEHALSLGIRRMVGYVLRENLVMRAWWSSLGATEITEVETQRHRVATLILDESLLEKSSAADHLRARLAWVRSGMEAPA